MALLGSFVMRWFINIRERKLFILELPVYRSPRWKRMRSTTMVEKAKIFVFQAGKIIMVISLSLWLLSSYGPANKMSAVTAKYEALIKQSPDQLR
jgi:ferrous iron transport protein B